MQYAKVDFFHYSGKKKDKKNVEKTKKWHPNLSDATPLYDGYLFLLFFLWIIGFKDFYP